MIILSLPETVNNIVQSAMSIIISDEILQASQLTPEEFYQEIALYLFQTGRLTVGYASQLAQISPNAFRQLLKQRAIPLYNYDVEDFELDLKNLKELGRL
jgi:predicted HTH domain antitoxin